ncbi:VWA domain-containing protein [Streptomyces lavenduligriseus]|uniref:VWA domain-containing protein n=1 Tax=Streptomyces lavenduligriseus TaxID=67315 RepID=A0ABT0NNK2_9ACTN|nr:VWA domain-containing protein [Streptomyces lavenduligriseus]MCL3993034.1 VWA domain-containing protein [Streptomyces lavenduligriseus]
MGILTLLRNAFGRSRKPRATEPEGAPETPEQPPVPEPRQSSTEEHDLVAAAFDKVKVPHQTPPAEQRTGEPEQAPEPTVPTEPEPEAVTETGAAPEAAMKTAADPEPEPKPKAEPAPEPEAAAPEPMTEAAAAPEPVAEAAPEPEPEPKAATEPEPEPKAAAEPAPEPKATAEPEPVTEEAEPEPVTEAAAGSEPEPETVPETEAEPAPQAEATAPAEPKPEPPTDAEGEAEATADTDPQAADGEDTSQGPPAPDNETRTGGAGGNTTAEGEAEAPAHTTPQAADGEDAPQGPPAPDNETRTGGAGGNTTAEGEAEAEGTPKPKPATPLTKVKSRTPALATAYKAATTTLRKKNLTGTRAKLYLVLDRSASMRPYYKDGSAQSLADQALALAAHLDPAPDPTVHVVFFSTEVDGTTDLTLTPGHDTKIDDAHAGLGRMGRTSYHAAVAAVLDHYDRHHDTHVNGETVPALVVFQTDGAPDAKTPATQALTEAAETHPGVFFSFVAFGDHDNKAFDYLRRLKTPNASFFHAGPTPRELTDTELYEGVLADWRP